MEDDNNSANGGTIDIDVEHEGKRECFWNPFVKQLVISSSLWTLYFLNGLSLGTPTVSIPQIRRESNLTGGLSEEMGIWLSSVFGLGGLPWVFILPILLEIIGRKKTLLIICAVTIIGFAVLSFSGAVIQILIGEVILGILVNSVQTILPILVTEYTCPRYRGIFLTIKSASFLWGVWVANAIGTFFHWKNIDFLAILCCFYTVSVTFWPESPYWLATKGRFEECTLAHRWLNGSDCNSERNLDILISSEKHGFEASVKKKNIIVNFINIIQSEQFYRPLLLSMLLLLLFYVNGKTVVSMYVIDIIKKITHNESAAYKTMLILDGVIVFSAYCGSISSKFLKRRTLLLVSNCTATVFLFLMSLHMFLIRYGIVEENIAISLLLLFVYSISGTGANLLCSSISGEILSFKLRGWSILIMSLYVNILHFSSLKLAPEIFKRFGLHVAFLFYGLGSSICLYLLYIYLPETKDKTLLEIENYFKRPPKTIEESTNLMVHNTI